MPHPNTKDPLPEIAVGLNRESVRIELAVHLRYEDTGVECDASHEKIQENTGDVSNLGYGKRCVERSQNIGGDLELGAPSVKDRIGG